MSAPREQMLRRLGRQLAAEQDAQLAGSEELATRAATRAVAAHVAARSAGSSLATAAQSGPSRTLLTVGALAAAVCISALWLHTLPLQVAVTGGAPLSVDQTAGSPDREVELSFSDRSEIALARAARLRLLALTRKGATLRLEAGSARVHITPDRGGDFTLHAGGFAVHVTGTRFVIDYQARDEVLSVRMLEGSVLVTGCALTTPQVLSVGQPFRASCSDRSRPQGISKSPVEVAHAPSLGTESRVPPQPPTREPDVAPARAEHRPHTRPVSPQEHLEPAVSSSAGVQPSASKRGWQQLARAGKFKAAYRLGRRAQLASLPVDEALLLGDAARLSGETRAARHIYERVRSLHPGSDAAAAAAFACGRLQFDQRAAYSDAARWFELYLREREAGPLAREARGRLVEALVKSGQHAAATRAAQTYLSTYPTGPHAAFARRVLQTE